MNPTPLISVACALLLFASKCNSQGNQPANANMSGQTHLSEANDPTVHGVPNGPEGAGPKKETITNSSITGGSTKATTTRPSNAQASLNSTSEGAMHSDANTTTTLPLSRNGTSVESSGTTDFPVETASSNASSMAPHVTKATVTTPTSKGSTAHAQVIVASSPGVVTMRGSPATSSGQASTTGRSVSSTPAANAATPSRFSRAASPGVLVATLGALLWWAL